MYLLINLLFRNISPWVIHPIMVLIKRRRDVTIARLWVLASIRDETIRGSWPVKNLGIWVRKIVDVFIDLLL